MKMTAEGMYQTAHENAGKIFLFAAAVMLTLVLMALPEIAIAGTADDGEFDEIWGTLEGWVQGTLGRILALVMIMVGIVYGIGKQNIMAFVMGPAAGIGLFYSPIIIENVVSANIASAIS